MGIVRSEGAGKGKGTDYLTIKFGGKNAGHFVGNLSGQYEALPAETKAYGLLAGVAVVDATMKSDKPGATASDRVVTGKSIRIFLREMDKDQKHTSVEFQVIHGSDVSAEAMKLFSKLCQVDLGKVVEIKPYIAEAGAPIWANSQQVNSKDTPRVSVKHVGDEVGLSARFPTPDGKLPDRETVRKADGSPVLVNGRQLYESGPWIELLETMYDELEARVQAAYPRDMQSSLAQPSHDDGEGVDLAEAAAAAEAAQSAAAAPARESFRARA